MKIIQITDLHIGSRGEETSNVDVRSNFLNILAEVKFSGADHLVVSGDLCFQNGKKSTYNWIKARLARLRMPYEVIPGNHDKTPLIKDVFELDHLGKGAELYYAKKLGKWTCLFLDSALGKHSENQLKWLKRQLYQADDEIIIFMHHPPVKVGVPFMDNNHALKDMEEVQQILFDFPHNITIFCGHYHVEKTIRINNLLIQITPSTIYQLDQNAPEFKIDHHKIALREIHLNGKSIQTTVRYFDGTKL